ncbi:hypothetical protein NLI96_g4234 [Meripilus lineatus]|uniref:Uncharacterized protein n=1 Tax=Meripilus lineatus TaxID=2056292 RepID=A0AAD5V5K6_9APHY|nr:hypothetical protein NLI96_g4234 [Physisporinus lineatus]
MDSEQRSQQSPVDTPQHPSRTLQSYISPPLSQPSLSTSSSTTTASESSLEEPLQNLSLESPQYLDKDHINHLGQSSEAHHSPDPTPDHHDQQAPFSHDDIYMMRNTKSSPQIAQPGSPDSDDYRPTLHHRTTSYSKRHASFDTPREVPLPYMPSRAEEGPLPQFSSSSSSHARPFSPSANSSAQADKPQSTKPSTTTQRSEQYHSEHRADSTSNGLPNGSSSVGSPSGPPPHSPPTHQAAHHPPTSPTSHHMEAEMMNVDGPDGYSVGPHPQQPPHHPQSQQRSISGPVTLFSRPFSSPDASRMGAVMPRIHSPTPVRASEAPDRSSTASLPLPMLTPYHTLPPVPGNTIPEGREMSDLTEEASASQSPAGPSHGSQQSHNHNRRQPPYARSTSPTTGYTPSRFSRSHFHRRDWYNENEFENPPLDQSLLAESASTSTPYAATALRDHRTLTSSSSIPSGSRPIPPPAPPVILTPPPSGHLADGSPGAAQFRRMFPF